MKISFQKLTPLKAAFQTFRDKPLWKLPCHSVKINLVRSNFCSSVYFDFILTTYLICRSHLRNSEFNQVLTLVSPFYQQDVLVYPNLEPLLGDCFSRALRDSAGRFSIGRSVCPPVCHICRLIENYASLLLPEWLTGRITSSAHLHSSMVTVQPALFYLDACILKLAENFKFWRHRTQRNSKGHYW